MRNPGERQKARPKSTGKNIKIRNPGREVLLKSRSVQQERHGEVSW